LDEITARAAAVLLDEAALERREVLPLALVERSSTGAPREP
jgi:hypothetical protein